MPLRGLAMDSQKTTHRIGIIGAGVSGLSAAYYLQQAGYANAVVLEKDRRVGGKCCSVEVDGRIYELGAVLGTRDYTATLGLMKTVGLKSGPTGESACYDPQGRRIGLYTWYQLPYLLWLLSVNYSWLTRVKYRRINRPGLDGIHPDLHAPFDAFAKRHGIPSLNRVLAPPFTGFGYGYFGEVPTAYVMKYLDLPTIEALRNVKRRIVWPDGVETLWARLAQRLDVRTGAVVRRVTREETVLVETAEQAFEFDSLILACPLDEALGFLDASPLERRLFSAIRTYDYWVLLGEVEGLPPESGYIPAHFTPEKCGHLMLWYHRWPGTRIFALYVLGDQVMGEDAIEQTCASDLARMGAALRKVHQARRWKYFPHVSSADMDTGYYERLEGLQGANNTYFAGELMSMSTVEVCARYSKALVERFFRGQPPQPAWLRAGQGFSQALTSLPTVTLSGFY